MNAAALRRLAALNLPADALAEVLSVLADVQQEADDARMKLEERRERDRLRKSSGKSAENPRNIQGSSTEIPLHARVVNTTSSSLRSEEGYDTTPQARERDLVAEMQEAAGPALDDTSPATHMPSEVRAWLNSGADFDLDVLPTIRARCASRKPRSVRSWAYFTQAVTDARDRRLSGLPPPTLMIEGKPSVRPAYETTAQQFSRAFENIGKRLAALDGD